MEGEKLLMVSGRYIDREYTVCCPRSGRIIVIADCEDCGYNRGYGLWYVPGNYGRDIIYGIGCNYLYPAWKKP